MWKWNRAASSSARFATNPCAKKQPALLRTPTPACASSSSWQPSAVLVLGGGGYGLYSYLNGDKEPETVVEQPKPVAPETPKDTATVAPEEPKVATPEPKRVDPKPTTPQNGRGTVDLGYGTYTGDLKNGKPHGYGTITYKKEQKIVPSKDFVAQPGDTFEGEFRDGRISGLGYWNHNGNKTAVKP